MGRVRWFSRGSVKAAALVAGTSSDRSTPSFVIKSIPLPSQAPHHLTPAKASLKGDKGLCFSHGIFGVTCPLTGTNPSSFSCIYSSAPSLG